MKTVLATMLLLILVSGCTKTPASPSGLVEVNSTDYGDTECFMKIVEIERNAKTSKLKFTYKKMDSSVGTSMFTARGVYEVAKARGDKYFINLKEWNDNDGARIFIVGFTNNENPDIQKEFGAEFSAEDKYGEPRMALSVSQFDLLWGQE